MLTKSAEYMVYTLFDTLSSKRKTSSGAVIAKIGRRAGENGKFQIEYATEVAVGVIFTF